MLGVIANFIFRIRLDMKTKCMQGGYMAILTIRDVPDELHQRLKEQAKLNRRSLNQEVIAELIERHNRGVAERVRFMNQMVGESKAVHAAVEKPMITQIKIAA